MIDNDELEPSSRLPGFYDLPITERSKISARFAGLNESERLSMHNFGALNKELTDTFIENSVGTFSLPLGVATNFRINKQDLLIPMAVEETSVLAAASHGAKLARAGGGFQTWSTEAIMTGQVEIRMPGPMVGDYATLLANEKSRILDYVNAGQQRLIKRGGGAVDLTWYTIDSLNALVLLLHVNTCDAMGANLVNTMCEQMASLLPSILPSGQIGLKILTNLNDRRLAGAECVVPANAFRHRNFSGREVVERVVAAYEFANHDVYRATTHNKGVMNGIDPVVIATGNDWRAVEAGAHAYAARRGSYAPITTWKKTSAGDLAGFIELPMALGTVGGVTKLHPTAQAALKLLGSPGASELAEIAVAVGLAQNLSALRALATEGIQRGHMGLHAKNAQLRQSHAHSIN